MVKEPYLAHRDIETYLLNNRDLKHRRRERRQRGTGRGWGDLHATVHALLLVHVLSRTWEPVVCRPSLNVSTFTHIITRKTSLSCSKYFSHLLNLLLTHFFFYLKTPENRLSFVFVHWHQRAALKYTSCLRFHTSRQAKLLGEEILNHDLFVILSSSSAVDVIIS